MILPRDTTRCMGINPPCPEKQRCLRHLDQPRSGMISWTQNLNPDPDEPCPEFIAES